MAFTARLSTSAVRHLCDHMDIQLPTVIPLPPAAFEPEARATAADHNTAQLRTSGWIDFDGEVEQRLATALRMLERPDHLIEAVHHDGSDATHAVLVAAGRRAVKMLVTGNHALIQRIPPDGLANHAVAFLPPSPQGRGHSVTAPTAALLAAANKAGTDTKILRSALQRQGVTPTVAYLVSIMNDNVISTAQFTVAISTRGRTMRRGDRVIGWWTTKDGAYLAERHLSSSGESWTTIVPADTTRLARQIERQLNELLGTVRD